MQLYKYLKKKELVAAINLPSGMPMGSDKNAELHFRDKPVCMCSRRAMPKGAKTEVPKGLRERNMSIYSIRNYLLRFR